MLARSPALRRGAKLILAIVAVTLLVAAGSILGDAVEAAVSATIFGF